MPLFLAFLAGVLVQGPAPRTRVAVSMITSEVSSADSTSIVGALVQGLQADSLVEVLPRPPMPNGRAIPGAQAYVSGIVAVRGERRLVSLRTFNVETSQIIARDSARGTPDVLADSVRAAGRRLAAAIARSR